MGKGQLIKSITEGKSGGREARKEATEEAEDRKMMVEIEDVIMRNIQILPLSKVLMLDMQ